MFCWPVALFISTKCPCLKLALHLHIFLVSYCIYIWNLIVPASSIITALDNKAGPGDRRYIEWGGSKNIRYWCTDLSSAYFCISIYAHSLWITSRVRQGLDVLPL